MIIAAQRIYSIDLFLGSLFSIMLLGGLYIVYLQGVSWLKPHNVSVLCCVPSMLISMALFMARMRLCWFGLCGITPLTYANICQISTGQTGVILDESCYSNR